MLEIEHPAQHKPLTLLLVLFLLKVGFVNGLAISNTGRFLMAAVGQEHRLGRWSRNSAARNAIQLIPLNDLKAAPKVDNPATL
jgi:hypothetical protein